mmetsp:Transcript_17277/g.30447  ORF Transcript_17277/g.30447 Transcript_17277/m.30447 type:complete len:281 (+) Transcript_17277:393-1235(+)
MEQVKRVSLFRRSLRRAAPRSQDGDGRSPRTRDDRDRRGGRSRDGGGSKDRTPGGRARQQKEIVRVPDATARNGHRQSPINIVTVPEEIRVGPRDRILFVEENLMQGEMKHNGYTISTPVQPAVVSHFEGGKFNLVEFHFHSPAEHTFNGVRHDLELHFVHKGGRNMDKLLVIGVLFKLGRRSRFLEHVFRNIPAEGQPGVPIRDIDITQLDLTKIFNYHGSLTTAPFSQGVRWCVVQKVHELSQSQLRQFRDKVPNDNYRPMQPTDGRIVVSRSCLCGH